MHSLLYALCLGLAALEAEGQQAYDPDAAAVDAALPSATAVAELRAAFEDGRLAAALNLARALLKDITQKAALRTFEVFWVIFFAISLGGAVIGLGAPGFPRPPPPPDGGLVLSSGEHFRIAMSLGHIGIMQMVLLVLMIFLYVGFRIYYARRYGDWETDEEQD